MPIYKYRAYKAGGAENSGSIEAQGPRDAAALLKAQGLYPKEITLFEAPSAGPIGRNTDRRRLPSITRRLAVLIRSGVPVVEALRALGEESKGNIKSVLIEIRERVTSGSTLARALEAGGGLFPDYYVSMVAAAEESGTLDTTLMRLADFLESQEKVAERVRTAMIYPTIMAGVAVIVLILLFSFVVPRIVTIFENHEAELPLATILLLWMSKAFSGFWWLIGGLAIAGALWLRKALITRRASIDRHMMRFLACLYLGRFTRTLGLLLEGGLPVMRAMELAGKASGNRWVESEAHAAAGRVAEGSSLSTALDAFPPVMKELIATGERSGRLPEVLGHSADAYEAEFDRLVQRFLAVLEPAMILAMAFVVAFIVFSVLMPIFQMNQLMR